MGLARASSSRWISHVGPASFYFVTPILERAVLIVLAVALYQVLSREAARYGDVLAYLTRYGR